MDSNIIKSYLIMVEKMIIDFQERGIGKWSEVEWARFENFMDDAIEKEFPKGVVDVEHGDFGGYQGFCPSCDAIVWDDESYCSKCGQKLKW